MAIDRTDRAIIAELARDSRRSIRSIAERVHISRTAAYNRVQNLIAAGVFKGFGAHVDRKSIGLNVAAVVIVKIGDVPWRDLAIALSQLPYVESVLAVSGDIDFVLTVSAPDHDELSEVIMRQIHGMPESSRLVHTWSWTAGMARPRGCDRTIGKIRRPKCDRWPFLWLLSAVCQQSLRRSPRACRPAARWANERRCLSPTGHCPTDRTPDQADRREGGAGAREAHFRVCNSRR